MIDSIDLSSKFDAHAYWKPGFGERKVYHCIVLFRVSYDCVDFHITVTLKLGGNESAATINLTSARLYLNLRGSGTPTQNSLYILCI